MCLFVPAFDSTSSESKLPSSSSSSSSSTSSSPSSSSSFPASSSSSSSCGSSDSGSSSSSLGVFFFFALLLAPALGASEIWTWTHNHMPKGGLDRKTRVMTFRFVLVPSRLTRPTSYRLDSGDCISRNTSDSNLK